MRRPPIQHCRSCGAAVHYRVPDDGDSKERAVCPLCDTVHYENPLNVVGTIPYLGDQVLLCLRNIEPRRNKWTLPAGFMELGETVQEGACRETVEEAGAQFELEGLFSVVSVVSAGQVHFFYRARLTSDNFDPGHETVRAHLYREADIPWDEIAFTTVRETLKRFFAERRAGKGYSVHDFSVN